MAMTLRTLISNAAKVCHVHLVELTNGRGEQLFVTMKAEGMKGPLPQCILFDADGHFSATPVSSVDRPEVKELFGIRLSSKEWKVANMHEINRHIKSLQSICNKLTKE